MSAFDDPEVVKKAVESRKRISGMINCRKLKRRRRKPGEVATRTVAIQNMCRECMGFTADDMPSLAATVKACTAYECWLWPWRNGKIDEEVE